MKSTKPQAKLNLFSNDPIENLDLKNAFFGSHLITYIGNKRRLLPFLYKAFLDIRKKTGKDKLIILDGFVGSGSTARLLKAFASELHVNDLEDYSETVNRAYLANKSEIDFEKLKQSMKTLNIIDARNIYNPDDMKKEGFNYVSIGRGDV